MNLQELLDLITIHRDREDIVISAEEWWSLRPFIAPEAVVVGTDDRPPFFWYFDKRIVTPQYVIAQRKIPRLAGWTCETCGGDHTTMKHLAIASERSRAGG